MLRKDLVDQLLDNPMPVRRNAFEAQRMTRSTTSKVIFEN
jgi:hypothetical protein